jgi:hypothetical protein
VEITAAVTAIPFKPSRRHLFEQQAIKNGSREKSLRILGILGNSFYYSALLIAAGSATQLAAARCRLVAREGLSGSLRVDLGYY